MKNILCLIFFFGLTSCTHYNSPIVETKIGEKIAVGSIRIELEPVNAPKNSIQPASIAIYVARVENPLFKESKDSDSQLLVGGRKEHHDLYLIKGASTVEISKEERPFFIPLVSGVYVIDKISFGYGSNFEFNLPKGGIPFVVEKNSDATNLGRLTMIVKMKNSYEATTDLRLDKVNSSKNKFISENPQKTIVDNFFLIP